MSFITGSSFRLETRGMLIGLILSLSGAGCSMFSPTQPAAAFESAIVVSPGEEVQAGGSVTIMVDAKRPPKGLVYRWHAPEGYGQCDPSKSNIPRTTYTAPPQLLGGRAVPVPVTVEFILNGEIIGQKVANIIVKPSEEITAQTVTPTVTPTVESKSAIQITQIPPYNLGGPEGMFNIAGKVSGASLSGYRVVLYAQTDYWYIQPFNTGEMRFTEIESDGSFSNQTHGGIKYAALLVRYSFTDPPSKTDRLPEIGKDVVAISIVQGIK